MGLNRALLIILTLISVTGYGQSFGTIKSLDFEDEKPKASADADTVLIEMDLKKLKTPGARGHVILRQFSNRARIEFNGAGLGKGRFVLAVGARCPGGAKLAAKAYTSAWTELHRFEGSSSHIDTEKSLPKASLKEPKDKHLVLSGKSLLLGRTVQDGIEPIDCKPVN